MFILTITTTTTTNTILLDYVVKLDKVPEVHKTPPTYPKWRRLKSAQGREQETEDTDYVSLIHSRASSRKTGEWARKAMHERK